jgi:hypothetical protein
MAVSAEAMSNFWGNTSFQVPRCKVTAMVSVEGSKVFWAKNLAVYAQTSKVVAIIFHIMGK